MKRITASTLVTTPYNQGNGYCGTLVNAIKNLFRCVSQYLHYDYFFFSLCLLVDIRGVYVLLSSSWKSSKREARDQNIDVSLRMSATSAEPENVMGRSFLERRPCHHLAINGVLHWHHIHNKHR